mmetsp:Transcript_11684/g.26274  ORF Transcript_11684/g.26274 Transcript_11684/m.26274 type:complete len:222 (-) Transcript_11684:390-1055(-)
MTFSTDTPPTAPSRVSHVTHVTDVTDGRYGRTGNGIFGISLDLLTLFTYTLTCFIANTLFTFDGFWSTVCGRLPGGPAVRDRPGGVGAHGGFEGSHGQAHGRNQGHKCVFNGPKGVHPGQNPGRRGGRQQRGVRALQALQADSADERRVRHLLQAPLLHSRARTRVPPGPRCEALHLHSAVQRPPEGVCAPPDCQELPERRARPRPVVARAAVRVGGADLS